ncbi:MAG: branched-chain amino acid ABC transporter permease [Acidimicrobiaceae bacterium]|jgi:branched-chain amino acid transport system permease protein|nr:branched-chain amino acid ABC transporter permease [Ilumatobacteraceae bacterium]
MPDWLIIRTFWDLTVTGLALGSIYALVALGYTLVYGVLRLINFAHSEIFMVGTFGSLLASSQFLNIPLLEDGNYPYRAGMTLIFFLVVILIIAMVFSGISAVLLERVAYRPLRGNGDSIGAVALAFLTAFIVSLIFIDDTQVNVIISLVLTAPIAYSYLRIFKRGRKAPRLAFLISAIGASTAIAEAVGVWGTHGRDQYQTARILEKKTVFNLFGTDVRIDYVIVIVGALLMMTALTLFVNKTRLGRGVRAVAQDAETSRILGVNVDMIIIVTFALGGVMAGGAAMLFTLVYDQTRFNIGFILGVKSFTAAVLGGIGNLKGALLGGLVLGLVENYGSAIFGGQWKDVIAFTVLLVVLMFRPTGLLGESLGKARV